jgi:hypothetical protein
VPAPAGDFSNATVATPVPPASLVLAVSETVEPTYAPEAGAVIVADGGTVSTVHVRSAGVASVLAPASVARTSNVCAPCARPVKARGLVHAAHEPPSRRHSKVEPGWSAEKAKLASASSVGPDGPASIVVSGATVSTVNVREDGASTLPAASRARTRSA